MSSNTNTDTELHLAEAIKAKAEAQAQVDDLQARLSDARSQVETTQRQRESVVHAAMVAKNPTARKALDKYTAEHRAAQDEVGNLELALNEARRRLTEADKAFYEADADHRFAQAQEVRSRILELDREIDAIFEASGAKFGEREALLDKLKATGVFDGLRRTQLRIDEYTFGRMLAQIVTAPNAHPALVGAFPNVSQFRPFASTLHKLDQSRLGLRRPDPEAEWRKAQPTAAPGTGDKQRAGILDDARFQAERPVTRSEGGIDYNPETGSRIVKGPNQDEMSERARATQASESGSGSEQGFRTIGEVEMG